MFLEAATGRKLRHWKGDIWGQRIAFSPDGKVLAQSTFDFIHLRDSVTGKPAVRPPRLPDYVMALAFSPGGKTLITGLRDGHTGRWDPLTGKERSPLRPPPEGFKPWGSVMTRPSLAPGGGRVALGDARYVMHVWETTSGKALCRIDNPPLAGPGPVFSPDGKLLAARHKHAAVVGLWEPSSGKLLRSVPMPNEYAYPLAVSPDSRLLATRHNQRGDGKSLGLWDTHIGKEWRSLSWEDDTRVTHAAFTPDGRLLVSGHMPLPPPAHRKRAYSFLRLWDVASGRVIQHFQGLPTYPANWPSFPSSIVISPDGKTLAAGANGPNWQRGETGYVQLWELASGKDRGRLACHESPVEALAFSPDGRLLASGSRDHTALVWDLTGLCPDGRWSGRELPAKDVERLWAELGGSDSEQAYRAMWTLAAAPQQSVPFLAQHLRPAAAPNKQHLTRLVADLDSAKFEVRQRAVRELATLGELAERALREVLAGTPSAEVRRQVEALLEQIDRCVIPAEQLHALRALEVLEHAGTPEARRVLEAVAGGAPEDRLTRAAKECLRRLSFAGR